jgi:hypothetical protein
VGAGHDRTGLAKPRVTATGLQRAPRSRLCSSGAHDEGRHLRLDEGQLRGRHTSCASWAIVTRGRPLKTFPDLIEVDSLRDMRKLERDCRAALEALGAD